MSYNSNRDVTTSSSSSTDSDTLLDRMNSNNHNNTMNENFHNENKESLNDSWSSEIDTDQKPSSIMGRKHSSRSKLEALTENEEADKNEDTGDDSTVKGVLTAFDHAMGEKDSSSSNSCSTNNNNDNNESKIKKVRNKDFEDVSKTGKWGSDISRKELWIASCCTTILVIIGVAIVLYIFVFPKENSNDTMKRQVFESADQQYSALLQNIKDSEPSSLLNGIGMTILPTSGSDITANSYEDENESMWMRTLSYLLYWDKRAKYIDELNERFVLIFLYLSLGGKQWMDQSNWLTDLHVCEWYGIECQFHEYKSTNSNITYSYQQIEQIDLAENQLIGTLSLIPFELLSLSSQNNNTSIFPMIESIFLSGNQLNGTIPEKALASIPLLSFLYLQDNSLSGTIPASLNTNGKLETLLLHGNNFIGSWPDSYCATCNTTDCSVMNEDAPFREFSLNCLQTPCSVGCCDDFNNCFND